MMVFDLVIKIVHGIRGNALNSINIGHRSADSPDQLLYQGTRTTGFGDEVKKRILLGTHVLTAG